MGRGEAPGTEEQCLPPQLQDNQQYVHARGGGRRAGCDGTLGTWRGARGLLQTVLGRKLILFQQTPYRRVVLCFAFTDGFLLKRGEGAITCVQVTFWVLTSCLFLSLQSYFSFELGYFCELLSTQSSLGKALITGRPGLLLTNKPH